jgi:hypothetical protein
LSRGPGKDPSQEGDHDVKSPSHGLVSLTQNREDIRGHEDRKPVQVAYRPSRPMVTVAAQVSSPAPTGQEGAIWVGQMQAAS